MKEMDWRASALRDQKLTTGDKCVIMALLMRADWSTWQGTASANDLAEMTAMSTRGVKLCLKRLEAEGWIERHAEKRADGLHHKATFKLMCCKVKGGSEIYSPYGEQSTQPIVNKVPDPSEQSTQPIVNKVPKGSEIRSPNINSYQLNDQLNDQQTNQPHDQHATPEVELDSAREDELELSRREAIDAGCYIMEPETLSKVFPSFISYNHKLYEITRHKRRQDVRDVIMQHDGFLASRAYELRLAPVSIVDWVMHLAESKRASQALLRR